jgi:membrane-bound lytic murein transglycosylase F
VRLTACLIKTGLLLGLVALLTTFQHRPPALAQVRELGALRVATVNSASTYYLGANGPRGFEYDLAKGLASELGVKLKLVIVADRRALIAAIANGQAQLGVGLAVSKQRQADLRFTPVFSESKLQAVYLHGNDQPHSPADLSGQLVLPDDTAVGEWLSDRQPPVAFATEADANTEQLMARISDGEIATTIANADLVAMNQRYYPNLRVAFTLKGVRQRLAWAFPPAQGHGVDNGLYDKTIAYLEQAKQDGRVHLLHDRYFGHAARLGFVGGAEFARQVKARLQKWKPLFKKTGRQYGLDWRLIAAVAYQESHWDQHAKSPTMVRGMMMLTRSTAQQMDVDNRRDPEQSVDGGTRYLLSVRSRLPAEIKPPDRTWFALAAYNVGLGHVLDARHLLRLAGRDPNVWVNLRQALGWLSQKRYLDKTRYGYAQGKQAAAYVGDIRAYYDILTWMTDKKSKKPKPTALDEKPSSAGADDADSEPLPDISIKSPAF